MAWLDYGSMGASLPAKQAMNSSGYFAITACSPTLIAGTRGRKFCSFMFQARLLGQFEILLDGRMVEIPSRPAQSLLADLSALLGDYSPA